MFEGPMNSLKQLFSNPRITSPSSRSSLQKWMPFMIGAVIILMMKTCFVSPIQESPENPNQRPQQESQKLFEL